MVLSLSPLFYLMSGYIWGSFTVESVFFEAGLIESIGKKGGQAWGLPKCLPPGWVALATRYKY